MVNSIQKRIVSTSTFAILAWLTGCCTAQTTILPKGGEKAEAISLSSTSDCCIKKAKSEAEEYCKVRNKSLVVMDEKSEYQGADKNLKAALGAVALFTPNISSNASSQEDYKTTMEFKCE